MSIWMIILIVMAVVVVGWAAKRCFAGREELAARRELRRPRWADSRGDRQVGGYPYAGDGIGYSDGGGGYCDGGGSGDGGGGGGGGGAC